MPSCAQTAKNQIRQHWTVPPKHRPAEQDEAEQYLFTLYLGRDRYWTLHSVRFSRWYLFVASFLIQFCIGSLYSWSVFNKPIDNLVFGDAKAEKAVNAFYTAVGTFGTTTAIMGPWIERHGPRKGMLLGTTVYWVGFLMSALSLHFNSIVGVYIGYGLLCGFGVGLCYICPVSALQKWFPDCRGTAAGFAVGGYGAGSVVWGKVYLPTINAVGLSSTFALVGSVMSVTMLLCAIVLRVPPEGFTIGGLNVHGERVETSMKSHTSAYEQVETPKDNHAGAENMTDDSARDIKHLTLIQSICTPEFAAMYVVFFSNQLFGLIVLSKLSSLCTDLFAKSPAEGANIVALNGIFNCCGRLVLPVISDGIVRCFKLEPAFGRKLIYVFTLSSQIIVVSTIPYLIRSQHYSVFVAEVFLLTTSYGGGVGVIPCFLTDMFGAYNIGAMHGLILTAWSIGGVAGGISFNVAFRNYVQSGMPAAEAYISIFHQILVVIVIGFVVLFLVRTNKADRFAPGYRFSICNKPVIHKGPRTVKRTPEADHVGA